MMEMSNFYFIRFLQYAYMDRATTEWKISVQTNWKNIFDMILCQMHELSYQT